MYLSFRVMSQNIGIQYRKMARENGNKGSFHLLFPHLLCKI